MGFPTGALVAVIVVVGGVVAGTSAAAGPTHTFPSSVPVTDASVPVPTSSISNGAPASAAEVESFVAKDTTEFSGVTSRYTKVTTLGTLAATNLFDPPGGVPASEPVIVDGIVGTFTPEFGHGSTFKWGAAVVDATNGVVLGVFAKPTAFPSFFTS